MKKKGITKAQLHRQKKKELEESLEYMRQVELPNSQGGGRKFVVDKIKEDEAKEKKEIDQAKNYAESKINQPFGYRERVATYAFNEIIKQNFPDDWEYYCIPTNGEPLNVFGRKYKTQEGLVYIIKSPKGEVFIRAIGVTYNPDIDIKNVGTMVVQIENTIDSWRGLLLSDNVDTHATLKRTKSGILLPN